MADFHRPQGVSNTRIHLRADRVQVASWREDLAADEPDDGVIELRASTLALDGPDHVAGHAETAVVIYGSDAALTDFARRLTISLADRLAEEAAGATGICRYCGGEIVRTADPEHPTGWRHEGTSPRHPAMPAEGDR